MKSRVKSHKKFFEFIQKDEAWSLTGRYRGHCELTILKAKMVKDKAVMLQYVLSPTQPVLARV